MIITIYPCCIRIVWFDNDIRIIAIGPIAGLGKTRVRINIALSLPAALHVSVYYYNIAIADIYQQRASMWKDIEMGLYSPEQFESAYKKIWAENVELTRFDMFVLNNATSVRFNYYESVHFQKQLGMISEEEWIATTLSISLEFYFPCSASYWEFARGFWRPSFASDVDKLIPKTGIPPCKYSPTTNNGG